MDKSKVDGKIVLCERKDGYSVYDKRDAVKGLGGLGVIIIDDESRAVAENYKDFPATVISSNDAQLILSYLNSTTDPVATILATATITNYKPAPDVAYFSSRGPSYLSPNILKPDIAAPGVNILAAWIDIDAGEVPLGKEASSYNVISGTSMACPHVSGVAAAVKSQKPSWGPSAIKSAIMTTATQYNNLKALITTDSANVATPYDYGAGEVTTGGPMDPGLVFETDTVDYLTFLCHLGYSMEKLKFITKSFPSGFACPEKTSVDEISNINYPSIAVSNFDGTASRNISRTVTNVGNHQTVYTVDVQAPSGLKVTVIPEELHFTESNQKLSYQVMFSRSGSLLKEPSFGTILWTNGQHKVRSPFVVISES